MLARMSFASELAAGSAPGLEVRWEEAFPAGTDLDALLRGFGEGMLGLAPDSPTLRLVRQEVGSLTDPAQRRAAAVALLLGSPEFQRQ
jgi:hypothetical protein